VWAEAEEKALNIETDCITVWCKMRLKKKLLTLRQIVLLWGVRWGWRNSF
jgi:hypothetical protein